MAIEVARDDLIMALSECAKIKPLSDADLGHVMLDCDGDTLEVSTSNGADTFCAELDADGSCGRCCVAALPLCKFLRTCDENFVELRFESTRVIAACGHTATIPALSDTPWEIPSQPDDMIVFRDVGIFSGIYAAERVECKPETDGMMVSNGTAKATNQHRMTVAAVSVDCNIFVPTKLALVASKAEGPVSIGASERCCHLSYRNMQWSCPLPIAPYPDMSALLEYNQAGSAQCDAKELTRAISRAMLFSEGRGVDLAFAKNSLVVTASGETGQSRSAVECDCDVEVDLRINGTYLNQAIAGEETADIDLIDDKSPIYITKKEKVDIIGPCAR